MFVLNYFLQVSGVVNSVFTLAIVDVIFIVIIIILNTLITVIWSFLSWFWCLYQDDPNLQVAIKSCKNPESREKFLEEACKWSSPRLHAWFSSLILTYECFLLVNLSPLTSVICLIQLIENSFPVRIAPKTSRWKALCLPLDCKDTISAIKRRY